MRKTKILATLGPVSNDKETIMKLINAGMDGARINFSHGDYESHEALIKNLKAAREELDVPIPLILDTKGPEIRIKTFQNGNITLEAGSTFILTADDVKGSETKVSVNYPGLVNDVTPGSCILLDDGLIELKVSHITGADIVCSVINGGPLKDNKGVNVPDVYLNLPALTQKDVDDICFGIRMDIDYIAASFIRNCDDIIKIRQVLKKNNGSHIKIIAKIENREGVNNIDSILDMTDGIMVARGDLGVEIKPEEVPIVQKTLIRKANRRGKTVITATQMLESMITNPRPTRAEANDVANAIFDGSDTVMLSGETASGKYPVESVAMMARIANTTEAAVDDYKGITTHKYGTKKASITDAISFATCTTAADIDASCIVTVTYSGFTARMVSKFRPPCPILAITANPNVYRQMNLVFGTKPMLCNDIGVYEKFFEQAVIYAEQSGLAISGDSIIIVAGVPIGMAGTTNTIRVSTVGDVLLKGKSTSDATISSRACVVKALGDAERNFQDGDILVAPKTTDELMPYMRKASAIIVGADNNTDYQHALTSRQALDIPVIICDENVVDHINVGAVITIDSRRGIIYNGVREL